MGEWYSGFVIPNVLASLSYGWMDIVMDGHFELQLWMDTISHRVMDGWMDIIMDGHLKSQLLISHCYGWMDGYNKSKL